MLRLYAALLALACAASVRADEWTRTDTALQLSFTAVAVVDWLQTVNFTQHPKPSDTGESNPLLGQHPSRLRVNTLVPAAIVTHALVAYALPRPYRTIWQSVWIGIEASSVHDNWRFGAGVSLPWN